MGKPVQWRAPDDCRQWLEAQPGGISPTLEMLVRGAMGRRRTPADMEHEIIRLEAQIELLTRLVQSNTTRPAPVEAPADDDDWGSSWGDKED